MSAMIPSHIPDIDLITATAERLDTWAARASPWTKFAGLILVVLLVTITNNLVICTALFLAVLLMYVAAGLPAGKLFAWYALPAFFVLSLVGLMAFSEPGIPVLSWNPGPFTVTLTDNGILLVIVLLEKALVSVTYSLFFLMSTRYRYFSAMISRIFPSPLDQVFLLAYRFLFLTLSMIGTMLKAVRSRGGGVLRSVRVQGRIFAEVFALVFIRSFDRAERVHLAMIARGYRGTLAAETSIPLPGAGGYIGIAAAALGIGALALAGPGPGWW